MRESSIIVRTAGNKMRQSRYKQAAQYAIIRSSLDIILATKTKSYNSMRIASNRPSRYSSWMFMYIYSSPDPFFGSSTPCIFATSVVLPVSFSPNQMQTKLLQDLLAIKIELSTSHHTWYQDLHYNKMSHNKIWDPKFKAYMLQNKKHPWTIRSFLDSSLYQQTSRQIDRGKGCRHYCYCTFLHH